MAEQDSLPADSRKVSSTTALPAGSGVSASMYQPHLLDCSQDSPTQSGVRTYSDLFSPTVYIERGTPQSDDDLIVVVVRIASCFRRQSLEPCEDLPSRPQRRSFFERLSTRWHGPSDDDKYQAVKMTRGDYKRYFARDSEGRYIGTEPERQWNEEEVEARFGRYQKQPLHRILTR